MRTGAVPADGEQASVVSRYEHYRQILPRFGQEHLLAFWARLSESQRAELLSDLEQVDFEECASLIDRLVRHRPEPQLPGRLEPPEVLPAEPDAARAEAYRAARRIGEHLIRDGCVAAFTVAGGQGTRLGYDGPKGRFPISPVRGVSLFQWFAEYLRRVGEKFGRVPRWYIMTSPGNHAATVAFFEQNGFFGLDAGGVQFFSQRQMPAFLPDGRIAMAAPHRLVLSPDGHGGSAHALRASGALEDMRRRGIEQISYFQVDNPLVKPVDPLFIGLHRVHESEMSSKAVAKADDFERVGVFARLDGRLGVLEYSDLPAELATARNPDGSRRFDAGSIAVHVLSRAFVERLTQPGSGIELGWHRAEKKQRVIDDCGRTVTPDRPNVIKLEKFIFDAIPLARNPIVLMTRREEEFSPVKNAEGVDSPATARRDLLRRAACWLEACGQSVPRDAAGEPAALIEISPAFALDADDLRERIDGLPPIRAGRPLLIA